MISTNHVDVEFIAFHTRDDISARNVVRLISAVEQLYDTFHSKAITEQIHQRAFHDLMNGIEEFDHPMWGEFRHLWREYINFARKGAFKGGAPILLPPFPGIGNIDQRQFPAPSTVLESLDAYRERSDHLIIDRIRISSPGGFSFKGSGEVISQLREFIKDIWYRNNQERIRGELELLEKALKLRKSHPQAFGGDSGVDRQLLAVARNGLDELRNLENEGVLLPPPERINQRPE